MEIDSIGIFGREEINALKLSQIKTPVEFSPYINKFSDNVKNAGMSLLPDCYIPKKLVTIFYKGGITKRIMIYESKPKEFWLFYPELFEEKIKEKWSC